MRRITLKPKADPRDEEIKRLTREVERMRKSWTPPTPTPSKTASWRLPLTASASSYIYSSSIPASPYLTTEVFEALASANAVLAPMDHVMILNPSSVGIVGKDWRHAHDYDDFKDAHDLAERLKQFLEEGCDVT